jgi:hypothetical protein
LIDKDFDGVYYPGPGLPLYDGALSGLLADIDLFYPSRPKILLCSYAPGPGLTTVPTAGFLFLS